MVAKFEIDVQKHSARFSIHTAIRTQLGLSGNNDLVHLVIKSHDGVEVFRGIKPISSGSEIYGSDISKSLKPGVHIIVEASVPAAGQEQDWTTDEVTAVVADYFAMLKDELLGKAYSKTVHRQALLKLLANCSGPAVEFKYCNISAVLQGMGLTYVAGYKPRGNYQALLAEEVRKFLFARPELRKQIVENDATPVDSPPDGSLFKLQDIEMPPPPPPPNAGGSTVKPAKVDWSEANAYSRKLGEQGEQFVLDLERRRLRDAGRLDLEAKVELISNAQGDGAGYDLRSFEEAGAEVFIEVKTTKGPIGTPFYVTENERLCSVRHAVKYRLYRVFQFRRRRSYTD